jgi:hypothetical protein
MDKERTERKILVLMESDLSGKTVYGTVFPHRLTLETLVQFSF